MPRTFESFLKHMPSGCIEWTGVTIKSNGRDSHRYGRFTSGGKKRLAHRVAYERAFGEIPDGMLILHRCDNTKYCNPAHLFLGSHLDNMSDMRAKGRSNKAPFPVRHGADVSGARLTDLDVQEIRRDRATGATTIELGRRFNVHSSVISRASRGVTYSTT